MKPCRLALCLAALSGPLWGSPLSGTFNLGGTITLTPTSIAWTLNTPPFTGERSIIGPSGAGDFAALGGTGVVIRNLTSGSEPVGVAFPPQPFISFLGAALPDLNISFVFPGIFGSAQCAAPAAVGQTCTTAPFSPFSFVNLPPPGDPQSVADFILSGVTTDGGVWRGTFASQFNVPYQTVLAQFAATGSVTNTFNATIRVTPSGEVAEPQGALLLGLGLAGLGAALGRRRGQARRGERPPERG